MPHSSRAWWMKLKSLCLHYTSIMIKLSFKVPKASAKLEHFQSKACHYILCGTVTTLQIASVSHQGRKCHVPVLLNSIALLYETSMQKIWKWSSVCCLGRSREAGALRAEQGSEMCWKHYNLQGPDARMQGTSDVCMLLLSYMAHDADDLVCWRGSFWLWVCVASVLPRPQAVCMHPRVHSRGGIRGCCSTPGPCLHHVHDILQPLAPYTCGWVPRTCSWHELCCSNGPTLFSVF